MAGKLESEKKSEASKVNSKQKKWGQEHFYRFRGSRVR